MTKKQFQQKVKLMANDHYKLLLNECDYLFDCGGIETATAENNFILPKTIIYVALLNKAHQYRPLNKESKKDIENLQKF